jgi:hypothetical protein
LGKLLATPNAEKKIESATVLRRGAGHGCGR